MIVLLYTILLIAFAFMVFIASKTVMLRPFISRLLNRIDKNSMKKKLITRDDLPMIILGFLFGIAILMMI